MEKKLKVGVGMTMIGMGFLLIGFLLFAKVALAQPRPEGTLRIALSTLAEEGFLPDIGSSGQARMYSLVYDSAFYNDERTNELIPGLAKRFEYSKDNLTLTLYLREGVPWQDTGKWGEVTAEDVKYTYQRIMGKHSTNTRRSIFAGSIKSMEVLNRYTLALHLKQPAPEFWANLTETAPRMQILCKKYVETVGDDKARWEPIGSGPYRLVERKTGEYLKFEASEKHWRVVPEFKYVILQMVPEETTQVAMLKTGQTDIISVSAQTMAHLQKVKGITAEPWPGGYTVYLPFGGMIIPKDPRYTKGYHWTSPWKDKRVRQAMNMAIDREAIVKVIYKGAARPISICWGLPGFDKLPPIPYDPKKASQLLAEAGYPNGFNLDVVSCNDWVPAEELPQVVEIVADSFKAIGLNATIKMMDSASLIRVARATKNVGMVYNWRKYWMDSYSGQFNSFFYPGGGSSHFMSDELMVLIDKYEKELNVQTRASALAKIRDYFYEEQTTIPIVMASPAWAVRNAVVGEWPKTAADKSHLFEYIRHAKPLNTWRLFTPGQSYQ